MSISSVKSATDAPRGVARMAPLSRLPLFVALKGKRAVVAGGTPAAAWKAELLRAAGARVDVFAPEAGTELEALVAEDGGSGILRHRRHWAPDDLAGAAIAVADCADDAEAADFVTAARRAGVPVNVVDRPAFCDFNFGAIVNRSPLVIGISSDGAAPVFAQAIRAKIETLIPRGFACWAEAACAWRPRLKALALSLRGRRDFWERFTRRALAAPDRVPGEAEFDALLRARPQEAGAAIVIEAPADPELLTLRALRALQSADVILFDKRVPAEILDFARREARKMLVGMPGAGAPDRGAMLASLAKAGWRVILLKAGDGPVASCATLHGPPIYVSHGYRRAARLDCQ